MNGPTTAGDPGSAAAAVLALLGARAPTATICPSEVARRLAASSDEADWRARMPDVHAAVDALMADGRVRLSWKGADLARREGPYRIASAQSPDRAGSIRSQRLP